MESTDRSGLGNAASLSPRRDPTEKRVLVTGGAGFIGSALVDALLRRENEVICYDNLSPYYEGKEENLTHNLANPRYKFIRSSILDGAALKKSTADVEVIFHLAAQPGVRYSLSNPEHVVRINVEGTVAVLEAARAAEVERLVFASSSAVYGRCTSLPIRESVVPDPISPYGASKLAAEHVCKTYSELYGLRVCVLRYFTVYGPRQRPDMAVSRFFEQMVRNRPITLLGDGSQTRDLTFVDDIVAGTIASAEANLGKYEVLNLGAGRRIEILDLVRALARLAGKTNSLSFRFEEANPADAMHTQADCSKARRLIGFDPKTSPEEGLAKFIAWHRQRFPVQVQNG